MLHAPGTPSSAALALHPGYIAGKNYTMFEGATSNFAVAAVDTLYFYMFRVYAPLTFTSAAVRIATGGTGSSMKSGIWANSTVSGRPLGVPLFSDNTGIATTGTGQQTITMAGTLAPGFYWWGTKHTGTLPTMTSAQSIMFLVPNQNTASAQSITFADAYANNIAATNIAEGATFTINGNPAPLLQLNT